MQKKGYYCLAAFWADKNYCGIINLDTFPARFIVEDSLYERGYGAFEVMEAMGTVVFHEQDHLERLFYSMEQLRFPASFKADDFFHKAVREVLRKNKLKSSIIDIRVSGGYTYDGFHLCSPPNVLIRNKPFFSKRFEGRGARLGTICHLREFPDIKTPNYCKEETAQPYVMGVKHCDDALRVYEGKVLEISTANFFMVTRRAESAVIFTAKDNILPGVTRKIVIDLAKKVGLVVREENIPISYLLYADEAFITSTTRFVWPVEKIDNILLSAGPVTLKLRKAFLAYRRDYYKDLLDKK